MPAYRTSTAPVLLLDGGMGRQLKAMGALRRNEGSFVRPKLTNISLLVQARLSDSRSGARSRLWRRVGGDAAERGPFFGWILYEAPQAPAFVLAAHAQYVEAGADVITTNAYAPVRLSACTSSPLGLTELSPQNVRCRSTLGRNDSRRMLASSRAWPVRWRGRRLYKRTTGGAFLSPPRCRRPADRT